MRTSNELQLVAVTVPCCDGWMETTNAQRLRLGQRAHNQLEVKSAWQVILRPCSFSLCLVVFRGCAHGHDRFWLTREHRKRMAKDDSAPLISSIWAFAFTDGAQALTMG
jgi:hypothetical protein